MTEIKRKSNITNVKYIISKQICWWNVPHNVSQYGKTYCKNDLKSGYNHFTHIMWLHIFSIISVNLLFLNYLTNASRICININFSVTDL